jgi:hypothetical protein
MRRRDMALVFALSATSWRCPKVAASASPGGFGGLPDVEERRKLFELLPAEQNLGMTVPALTSTNGACCGIC